MNRGCAALVVAVIALTVAPVLILHDDKAAWTGSDSQAVALVQAESASYRPWVGALWTPPSPEVESLLFALQAALGAGCLGYACGYLRGRATARLARRCGNEPA